MNIETKDIIKLKCLSSRLCKQIRNPHERSALLSKYKSVNLPAEENVIKQPKKAKVDDYSNAVLKRVPASMALFVYTTETLGIYRKLLFKLTET